MTEKQMKKIIEKAKGNALFLFNEGLRAGNPLMDQALDKWLEMLLVYYNMEYINCDRKDMEDRLKLEYTSCQDMEPMVSVAAPEYDYY